MLATSSGFVIQNKLHLGVLDGCNPLGWFADGSANPSSPLRLVENSCMSLVRSVSSATAAGRLPSPAGGTQTKSVEKLAAHALCPFPHNVPIVSPII